jgi:hypothetical protein
LTWVVFSRPNGTRGRGSSLETYKQRNLKRVFCRLKDFQRIATRYDNGREILPRPLLWPPSFYGGLAESGA